MKRKKYLIYLLILAALASYYFYFEVYRKGEQEKAALAKKKVFEVDAGKIDKIVLVHKGDAEIVLNREGNDNWTIEQPLKVNADRMEVDELIGYLNKIERQMSISEKSDDLKQYGLVKPSLTIRFQTGAETEQISFGDKNLVSNDYYAKVKDQPEIFVTAAPTYDVLNKDVFKLRNKAIFSMQYQEVDGIDLEKDDFRAVLDKEPKKESSWKLRGSEDVHINPEAVKDIARQFVWLRATAFDQENDDNLQKYGLDKPRAAITLKKGDKQEKLLIGSKYADGKTYAKKVGRPGVFSIEERYTDLIPNELKHLEDRGVMSYNIDEAKTISWSMGGKEYKLSKLEDKWTWTTTADHKGLNQVDTWAVEGALWQLKGLEYSSKDGVSKPADDSREWWITVSTSDGKPLAELIVYTLGDQSEEEIPVSVKTDGEERLFKVHRKSLQDVRQKLEDLVGKKS